MAQDFRRRELLKQTLFYKGEDACPEEFGEGSCYWDYERLWVRWELEQDEQYIAILRHFLTDIVQNNPVHEGVPIGLQAIFASRISYWDGGRSPVSLEDVHEFCRRYEQTYAKCKNAKRG